MLERVRLFGNKVDYFTVVLSFTSLIAMSDAERQHASTEGINETSRPATHDVTTPNPTTVTNMVTTGNGSKEDTLVSLLRFPAVSTTDCNYEQ
jgi:hypothetical protein